MQRLEEARQTADPARLGLRLPAEFAEAAATAQLVTQSV